MTSTFTSVPEAAATGRLAAGYSARRGSPDRERLALRQAAAVDPVAKALALEQLGNQERNPFFVTDIKDGENVGVVEGARRARFELEAGQAIGVSANDEGSILTATSRPNLGSRARYTSPIPPAPIFSTI